jgi:uncharacterized membrane protein/mono/diheme cytochrome c family protein
MIVAFLIGLLIFPPLYESPKGEVSTMVLFIGRFHPILLHLPVGILGALCLFELFCSTRRGEARYGDASLVMLICGTAGSLLAMFAGIMLSREGGYVGGNFTLHQTMAIIGTAGVLLALVVRIVGMSRESFELLNAYRALFFISFGIMGLGAHFGGNMSHGSKFLTEFAPEPIKSQMIAMEKWMLSFVEKPKAIEEPEVKPAPTPEVPIAAIPPTPAASGTPTPGPSPTPQPPPAGGGDKLVFQHLILPIFEAKCNKCHGEEKQKGELRLDTYEFTMKGGEESGDKNIVAGKPDESVTVQLISSAEDEDGHMPPEGKDQLTKEETALIKWWIQQGASNTQKFDAAALPAELKAAAEAIVKG